MTIEQTVLQTFRELPPDKQQEVLDFIQFLKYKLSVQKPFYISENHKSLRESKGITDFWSALQDFRQRVDLESIDDDTFEIYVISHQEEKLIYESKYLLDTNILSEAKRPHPNEKVMENLRLYRQETATAILVIHEMLYGCFRLPISKKRQDIEDYINNVILAEIPLFDYDLKSAQYHAQERARLSKIGKNPGFIDGQIASIAVTNNLILVTNNVADFQDFDGINIENWFIN